MDISGLPWKVATFLKDRLCQFSADIIMSSDVPSFKLCLICQGMKMIRVFSLEDLSARYEVMIPLKRRPTAYILGELCKDYKSIYTRKATVTLPCPEFKKNGNFLFFNWCDGDSRAEQNSELRCQSVEYLQQRKVQNIRHTHQCWTVMTQMAKP